MTIPARLRGPARLVAGLVAALTLAAPVALLGPSWATAAPLEPVVVAGMNLDSGGTAVINELEQSEVAPGLTHLK